MNSSCPPPIVPIVPPCDTSIHAPASRGVDPRAVSTRTSIAGPASRNAATASGRSAITPPRAG